MTVTRQNQSITHDVVSGINTYVFNFRVDAADDLRVFLYNATSGVTVEVSSSSYTVTNSVVNGVGPETGGFITYTAPTSTALQKVTIVRQVAKTQTLDLDPTNGFNADALETRLDRIVMMVQDIQEGVDRSLKVPLGPGVTGGDFSTFSANSVFGVSSDAQTLTMFPTSELGGSSSDSRRVTLRYTTDFDTTNLITANTEVVECLSYDAADEAAGSQGWWIWHRAANSGTTEPHHYLKRQHLPSGLWFEMRPILGVMKPEPHGVVGDATGVTGGGTDDGVKLQEFIWSCNYGRNLQFDTMQTVMLFTKKYRSTVSLMATDGYFFRQGVSWIGIGPQASQPQETQNSGTLFFFDFDKTGNDCYNGGIIVQGARQQHFSNFAVVGPWENEIEALDKDHVDFLRVATFEAATRPMYLNRGSGGFVLDPFTPINATPSLAVQPGQVIKSTGTTEFVFNNTAAVITLPSSLPSDLTSIVGIDDATGQNRLHPLPSVPNFLPLTAGYDKGISSGFIWDRVDVKGWQKGWDLGAWGDGNKDFLRWNSCRADDCIIGKSFGATQIRQSTDIDPNGSQTFASYSSQRSGTASGRMELEVINYHAGNQANVIEMTGGAVVGKVVFEGPYFESVQFIGWRGTGGRTNGQLVIDTPNIRADTQGPSSGQFRIQAPIFRNPDSLGSTIIKGGQLTTNPGNTWLGLEGKAVEVVEKVRITTDIPDRDFTQTLGKGNIALTRAYNTMQGMLLDPRNRLLHDIRADIYDDENDPEGAIVEQTIDRHVGFTPVDGITPYWARLINPADTTNWATAPAYNRYHRPFVIANSGLTNSSMVTGKKTWQFEVGALAAWGEARRIKRGLVPGSLLYHTGEKMWFYIRAVLELAQVTVIADCLQGFFIDFTNDRYEWFAENTSNADMVSRGSGLVNNGLTNLAAGSSIIIAANRYTFQRPAFITTAGGATGTLSEGGITTTHTTIASAFAAATGPVYIAVDDDEQDSAKIFSRDATTGNVVSCTSSLITFGATTSFTGTARVEAFADAGAPPELLCDGGFIDSLVCWDKVASGTSSPITNYSSGVLHSNGQAVLTNASAANKQGISQAITFDSSKNYTVRVSSTGGSGVSMRETSPTGTEIQAFATGEVTATVAGSSLTSTVCFTPADTAGVATTILYLSIEEQ